MPWFPHTSCLFCSKDAAWSHNPHSILNSNSSRERAFPPRWPGGPLSHFSTHYLCPPLTPSFAGSFCPCSVGRSIHSPDVRGEDNTCGLHSSWPVALPGGSDSSPLGFCYFSFLDLQASTTEAPRVQRTRHLEPGRGQQPQASPWKDKQRAGLSCWGESTGWQRLRREETAGIQIPSYATPTFCLHARSLGLSFAGVPPVMDASSLTHPSINALFSVGP